MFSLKYIVVKNQFDDFFGQNGFFEFRFNQKSFGEIYSEDVIDKIYPENLYDWLCHLVEVAIHLKTKKYVLLSCIEDIDGWIEFRRNDDKLFASMIKSEKCDGSSDIEFQTRNEIKSGEWSNEEVSYRQFTREILVKVREYVRFISTGNPNHIEAEILNSRLDFLDKISKKISMPILRRKAEERTLLDRMALKYKFLSDDKKYEYWWRIYKNVCYLCNIKQIIVLKGDFYLVDLKRILENDGPEYCGTVTFKTHDETFYTIGVCVRGVPIFKKLKSYEIESLKGR
ncbi:MAG: hypothetical protein IJ002_06120 [Clostridia bacterium]|nr:hypothetical protein [Clostridia bacterium]